MWSCPWESGKCLQNPQSHAWCYSQVATIPNDTLEIYYNSQLLQLFPVLKGIFLKHFLWLKGHIYLMYISYRLCPEQLVFWACVLSKKEMLPRFWGTSPSREQTVAFFNQMKHSGCENFEFSMTNACNSELVHLFNKSL